MDEQPQESQRREPRRLSLTRGGPAYLLLQRLRLIDARGRVRSVRIALFAWLPIALGAGIRFAFGKPIAPTFFDLSVHTRLLVALPMMFLAERLFDSASASAVNSLYASSFCERAPIEQLVGRAERARDTIWVEALLALVALVGGQLALWNVIGPTGVIHGGATPIPWTFARIWYVGFALPLFQFVMFRWFWRWALWSWMLAKIAALPLDPLATHPDQAAGLACLSRPVSAFSGFIFAMGAVVSGAWGSRLIAHQTTVEQLLPEVVIFLITATMLAVGPLLPLCGHLYRARRRALAQYGDFADQYMRAFHLKWLVSRRGGGSALGEPDIQSMNDLMGAFDTVSKTRLFAFGMRAVIGVWGAAAVPMLPLLASTLTLQDVVKRIFSAVLGGLPL